MFLIRCSWSLFIKISLNFCFHFSSQYQAYLRKPKVRCSYQFLQCLYVEENLVLVKMTWWNIRWRLRVYWPAVPPPKTSKDMCVVVNKKQVSIYCDHKWTAFHCSNTTKRSKYWSADDLPRLNWPVVNWPAEVYGLVKEQLKMMTIMKTMTMVVKRGKMAREMACYEISCNFYQRGEDDNASDNGNGW